MSQHFCRIFMHISKSNWRLLSLANNQNILVCQVRGRKRWLKATYRALYKRREEVGPERERPRSAFINWNYDAEIYAFGQRLKEDFQESTLRRIFTHSSYVEREKEIMKEANMEDTLPTVQIEDNTAFIQSGEDLVTRHVKSYLRHSYPALPEEAISDVTDNLTTEDLLADIGSKIGVKDLIMADEFPCSTKTLSETLMAVIGGLKHDQGEARAELFIQDFILTALVGKDIMEIWKLTNPMGVLQSIVSSQGGGEVESRLLFETGGSTVLAVYMVGIYSEQQLLGKGYGETLSIAEEMAARDGLRNYFGTSVHQKPLPFGPEGSDLGINQNRINRSVRDFHPNQ